MFERIRRRLKPSKRQSPLQRGSFRRDQRRKQLRTEILESRLLLAGDSEVEPNGDRFTANQLQMVEGVPGFLSGFAHGEVTEGDSDFFTFEAFAGDQISLAVDTSVDGLDPQVVLRNSAGAQLRQDSNSGPYGSSLTS
ncbi:MAG: PPC domain-containing protein, partial [Planctomycetota bacterium]